MPGPAPNPDARRRNKRVAAATLPVGGRTGRAPAFPIKSERRVPSIWPELWKTPQAAAWEKLGYHRVVARYAIMLTAAEKADAPAALLSEVRQLEDRLGLTPMSMKRLEWVISEDEVGEQRSARRRSDPGSGRTPEERRRIMAAVK